MARARDLEEHFRGGLAAGGRRWEDSPLARGGHVLLQGGGRTKHGHQGTVVQVEPMEPVLKSAWNYDYETKI